MNTKSLFSLLAIAAVFFFSGSAAAKPQSATAAGTAFTYQGRLIDGGSLANGVYDFTFTLFDADVAGTQIGSPVALEDVIVTDGLFTVQLDFGAVYDGSVRFLEIGVRPGASTGTFTLLGPRQRLNPTPYALNAFTAPWSGLTGIPAGFADGIDDIGTYTNGKGLQLIKSEFSVLFGGSGTANTAARSDHDHWGASWAGTGTGLTLAGGTTGVYADGTTYGLYGTSLNNIGVFGQGNYGVFGYTPNTYGIGVYGASSTGANSDFAGAFNGNVEVFGHQVLTGTGTTLNASGGSIGVDASGSTYGVHGSSNSGSGIGTYGTSTLGTGVVAKGAASASRE